MPPGAGSSKDEPKKDPPPKKEQPKKEVPTDKKILDAAKELAKEIREAKRPDKLPSMKDQQGRTHKATPEGYLYGADPKKHGNAFSDCSHFVHRTLERAGVKVEYASTSGIGKSKDFVRVEKPQPGDVLVQGGHMGVYVGQGPKGPMALQMGDHGPSTGPFGPRGWFGKAPVKYYRPSPVAKRGSGVQGQSVGRAYTVEELLEGFDAVAPEDDLPASSAMDEEPAPARTSVRAAAARVEADAAPPTILGGYPMLPRFSTPDLAIFDDHLALGGERIPLSDVQDARVRSGVLSRSLEVTLADGTTRKADARDPDLAARVLHGVRAGRVEGLPLFGYLEAFYVHANRIEVLDRSLLGTRTESHVFIEEIEDVGKVNDTFFNRVMAKGTVWQKPRILVRLRDGQEIGLDFGDHTDEARRLLLDLLGQHQRAS